MRKIFLSFVFLLSLLFLLIFTSSKAYAATCTLSVTEVKNSFSGQTYPFDNVPHEQVTISLQSSTKCFIVNNWYSYLVYKEGEDVMAGTRYVADFHAPSEEDKMDKATIIVDLNEGRYQNLSGPFSIRFCFGQQNRTCSGETVGILSGGFKVAVGPTPISAVPTPTPTPTPTPIPADLPKITVITGCVYAAGEPIKLILENLTPGQDYRWWWYGDSQIRGIISSTGLNVGSLEIPGEETRRELRENKKREHVICVDKHSSGTYSGRGGPMTCSPGVRNTVHVIITEGIPTDRACTPDGRGPAALALTPGAPTPTLIPSGTPFQPKLCTVDGKEGVDTAVGCIPTNPAGLVSFLLRLILGLSGGIALLLIIFSGYRMATSAGNPEALQGARETLTSAIVGLVFIIFSLVILEIIGVDILAIPGFGK